MRRWIVISCVASVCACSLAVDFEGYDVIRDAGFDEQPDAGQATDDAGVLDASTPDGGVSEDAGEPDAGVADAGADSDAGFADSGIIEVRSATVSLGGATACAITATDVVCWGRNWSGEAGNCMLTMGDNGVPPAVVGNLLTAPTTLASGQRSNCVSDEFGEVFCFGRSQHRTFNEARGDVTCSAVALTRGLERFIELDIGGFHACGLDSLGALTCWGLNDAGQLGDGMVSGSRGIEGPTVLPPAAGGIAEIELGFNTTCVRTQAGEAYCWGKNTANWMSLAAPMENVSTPTVAVAAPPGLASIELSTSATSVFACGVANGEVRCWGEWADCPLPAGDSRNFLLPAGAVVTVDVGARHVCVLNDLGDVYCFGNNDAYQLSGTSLTRCQLRRVEGLGVMTNVVSGADFNCAVAADDVVWCWGSNRYGQVGVDPNVGPRRVATPQPVFRTAP